LQLSAAAARSPASLQDAAKKLPRMKDGSSQCECLNRGKNVVVKGKSMWPAYQ
jgi:hypothetical protein